MSHVTHVIQSCHTYERDTPRTCMRHVTHLNASCDTYECVISHIRLSHVTPTTQARNQEDTLHETGVSLLTLSQARVLCGKRTDLIASTMGAQI